MTEALSTQNPEVAPSEKKHSFKEEAFETFRFLLIALAIVIPIRFFIAQPFIVSGASMDPTFKDKQYLIVDELSYNIGDPTRGDVAIFKYPKNPKQYFIKRVIGLPGETVLINSDGKVSIKNKDGNIVLTLKEPYVAHEKNGVAERSLKADEYFMMGDNRAGSFDSRAWGPVPRELIVGKAFLRLFPYVLQIKDVSDLKNIDVLDILPGQFRQ